MRIINIKRTLFIMKKLEEFVNEKLKISTKSSIDPHELFATVLNLLWHYGELDVKPLQLMCSYMYNNSHKIRSIDHIYYSNAPKSKKDRDEIIRVHMRGKKFIDEYDFDKYTVPSIKQLKSKSYYVQIAVLSDKANIKAILDKYSSNYPITLVPMASGKATQVLVGPLSVDEYGTVLNRFKAYGYKDAFLRKIR